MLSGSDEGGDEIDQEKNEESEEESEDQCHRDRRSKRELRHAPHLLGADCE